MRRIHLHSHYPIFAHRGRSKCPIWWQRRGFCQASTVSVPWREGKPLMMSLQSMNRYFISRFCLFSLGYQSRGFLTISESVFNLATQSIFKLLSPDKASKKVDDVLYEDLRNHFSTTFGNYHKHHPSHTIHYELKRTKNAKFLTGELVWYSTEYFQLDEELQKVDSGAMHLYFIPELIPREQYEFLTDQGPPLDRSLLRIWVEYDCEGSLIHAQYYVYLSVLIPFLFYTRNLLYPLQGARYTHRRIDRTCTTKT
jgi:hypothetical protein